MDANQRRLLLLEAEIERRALIEDRERRLRAPLAKAKPQEREDLPHVANRYRAE
jgi:hypothetical protein